MAKYSIVQVVFYQLMLRYYPPKYNSDSCSCRKNIPEIFSFYEVVTVKVMTVKVMTANTTENTNEKKVALPLVLIL